MAARGRAGPQEIRGAEGWGQGQRSWENRGRSPGKERGKEMKSRRRVRARGQTDS